MDPHKSPTRLSPNIWGDDCARMSIALQKRSSRSNDGSTIWHSPCILSNWDFVFRATVSTEFRTSTGRLDVVKISKSVWDRRPSSLRVFNCAIASAYTLSRVYASALLFSHQPCTLMDGFGNEITLYSSLNGASRGQPCNFGTQIIVNA